MSDHGIYYKNYKSTEISAYEEIEGNDDPESVIEEEKSGDEFLIELYRERSFLYDKKDRNFKNILMRENGLNEISKIMIATNSGDIYTPQYCQKRCTSLIVREQYNREKKRRESQFKSGNAASNSNFRPFLFYSHLTFLDQVIKRRRTYSNARSQASASFVEKNKAETEIDESDTSTFSSNKENTSTNSKYNMENSHQDVSQNFPKVKNRKMNETKQLEQTFLNISNNIMSYMETSNSKQCTPDDAFIEFIKVQFNIPEHEKNIRRKMIMDTMSTPLNM